MEDSIIVILGRNIQKHRKQLGITQAELSQLSGLHRTYIGMIERAEKNVTIYNIQKIAKALNINITELFK